MQTDIYKYFGKSFNATSIEKLAATLLKMMSEGNICIHFPDLTDEEKEKYPLFSKAAYVEVLLPKGTILHLPKGWWYASQSLEDSIQMTIDSNSIFSLEISFSDNEKVVSYSQFSFSIHCNCFSLAP